MPQLKHSERITQVTQDRPMSGKAGNRAQGSPIPDLLPLAQPN